MLASFFLSVVSRCVGWCVTLVALGVGGPQGEVVPQQLHDERGVLVAVLVQGVQLGDGVVESLQ